MSRLFEPLALGELTLENRVIVAPMCQYAVADGTAADWHMVHLGHLALSGAGLLTLEATAVSAEGRISPRDLGLYSDANEAGLARVLTAIRSISPIPVAIQLGHAGRKASSRSPFEGGAQIRPDEEGGWLTVAPSAIPHAAGDAPPEALDEAGMERVKVDFATAAERSARIGIDAIELHMAHGYLLHQFLSPLSNRRDDAYGGAIEGRMRFPVEIFEAVRAAFPVDRPIWVRVSASDWVEGGLSIEDILTLCRALKAAGCAAVHVSSGGVSTEQKIPLGPGYQVHLAKAVKDAVELPVIAVGLITKPEQAEAIIASGEADAIALARAMLWNPRWPWHAAAALGATVRGPKQYWRSAPAGVAPPFEGFAHGQR
ncbi:NADH:flavin oxidoreductase/NADH oxidase [Pikeienuella piscinae]|uniref:NADH:flavin oxidoreductase/NADH oxidase n=1 Tax=Pikeienuella piscinae TaxID=2748098 RepID=A0A7L5BUF5_9RHOB|nr:NADH:flavin oxidoreductase/NADH oxidase [Pikeienuella piscinae]QIE55890.1 NADH:flavin oxidoreductase/NADH oxidase [Pikeienuella piscinae]